MQVNVPNLELSDVKQAGAHGVTTAARIGYLTHGLVYGLIGVLALLSAVGHGGGVTDSEGAVHRIGASSYGAVLLWAVAIGLGCYALWNVVRVVLDPERHVRDGNPIVRRCGYAISAISHGLLAAHTFQLAYGAATEHGDNTRTIAQGFNMPGGRVLVALIGAGVIGFGLFEIFRSINKSISKEFNGAVLPKQRTLIINISRIGHGARGVVFAIVGSSLIVAAFHARASEAHGFDDALRQLAAQPFGSVLLGIVAAGLIAYGLDMLLLARYARIPRI